MKAILAISHNYNPSLSLLPKALCYKSLYPYSVDMWRYMALDLDDFAPSSKFV